jgi:hypothetical protein
VLLIAALAGLAACSHAPTTPRQTVYERYAQLQADQQVQAAFAAPAERIREMAWMIGDWRVAITVFATATQPESREELAGSFRMQGDSLIVSDDLSTVLGYDGFAQRWFNVGFEPPAAPFTYVYTDAWDGARMVSEGDVVIFGEAFPLRQTMTKLSDNEFVLLNEQRMPSGAYVPVDEYRYSRVVSP